MTSFKHYCTCGGFAWTMNGRPKEQPHMAWCPQADEYAQWFNSLPESKPTVGKKSSQFANRE
jgi:hypothetical protein